MDTDASINDHMTSDEMYMQLQADMVSQIICFHHFLAEFAS